MLLKPSEAARKYAVTVSTLRKWECDGSIKSVRSVGNHRRYIEKEENEQEIKKRRKIAYCRVKIVLQPVLKFATVYLFNCAEY